MPSYNEALYQRLIGGDGASSGQAAQWMNNVLQAQAAVGAYPQLGQIDYGKKLLNDRIGYINASDAQQSAKDAASGHALGHNGENALEKLFHILGKPKTAVVAGIAHLVDPKRNFMADLRHNVGTADVLSNADWFKSLPTWAKIGVGVAGDIAADPLTHIGPQALLGSAAELSQETLTASTAARKAAEEATAIGDTAAAATHTANADRLAEIAGNLSRKGTGGIGRLGKDEMAFLSDQLGRDIKGGLYFNVPGTGRIGQTISGWAGIDHPGLMQIPLGRPDVLRKVSTGLFDVSAGVRGSKTFGAMSESWGGGLGKLKNARLNAMDASEANKITTAMSGKSFAENAARQIVSAERQFVAKAVQAADKAGIDTELVQHALGGNVDAIGLLETQHPEFWSAVESQHRTMLERATDQANAALRAAGVTEDIQPLVRAMREDHQGTSLTEGFKKALGDTRNRARAGDVGFQQHADVVPGNDWGFMVDNPATGKPAKAVVTLAHPSEDMVRAVYRDEQGIAHTLASATRSEVAADPVFGARLAAGEDFNKVGEEFVQQKAGPILGDNPHIEGEQMNTMLDGKPAQIPTDKVTYEPIEAHPEGLSAREQANAHAADWGFHEPFDPNYARSELNYINQLESALKNNILEAYLVHHGVADWKTASAAATAATAKVLDLIDKATQAGAISAESAARYRTELGNLDNATADVTGLMRKAGGGADSPEAVSLQSRIEDLTAQHQDLLRQLGDELAANGSKAQAQRWADASQTPLDAGGPGAMEAAGAPVAPAQTAAPAGQELNPTQAAADQFSGLPAGTPTPSTPQEVEQQMALLQQHTAAADAHVAQRLPELQDELARASELAAETRKVQYSVADIRQMRQAVREEAKQTLDSYLGELERMVGGDKPPQPPNLVRSQRSLGPKSVRLDGFGNQVGGEWDWWEGLSRAQQSGYRQYMGPVSNSRLGIDDFVARIGRAFGRDDMSETEAMTIWRNLIDRIDVLTKIGKGRNISGALGEGNAGWIAPRFFQDTGIDPDVLLLGRANNDVASRVTQQAVDHLHDQIVGRNAVRPIDQIQAEMDQLGQIHPNLEAQTRAVEQADQDIHNGITPIKYVDGFNGPQMVDSGVDRGVVSQTNDFLRENLNKPSPSGTVHVTPEDVFRINELGAAGDSVRLDQHVQNLRFFVENDVPEEIRKTVESAFDHVADNPVAAAAVRTNAADPMQVNRIVVANVGVNKAIADLGIAASPSVPSAIGYSSWASEQTARLEQTVFDMVARKGGVEKLSATEKSLYDQLTGTKALVEDASSQTDKLNIEYWAAQDKAARLGGVDRLSAEERAALDANRNAHQAYVVAADAAVRDAHAAQQAFDEAAYAKWFYSPAGQNAINEGITKGLVEITRNAQSTVEVDNILAMITRATSKETQSKFLTVFDGLTRVFKAWSISNPGFIIRHGYTGMFMNYLNDVAPGMYRAFLKADRAFTMAVADGASIEDALAQVPAKYRDSYELIHRSGILTNHSQIAEAFGADAAEIYGKGRSVFDRAANNPITRSWNKSNFAMSRITRGAAAMHAAETKGTVEAIYDLVSKAHFDYADINNFERVWGTRAMPFYIFFRKSIPAMIEGIFRNPKAFARFGEFQSSIQAVTSPEDLVPEWMRDRFNIRLPLQLGQGTTYLMPDLPIRTLTAVTDPNELLGNINPLIKTPIEMKLNSKLYFGNSSPFLGDVQMPEIFKITGIGKALQVVGMAHATKDGQLLMNDKALYAIEQFFPYFGKARRLLPTEQRYQDRLPTTVIDFLFGAGLRTVTESDQLGELSNRIKQVDAIAAQQNKLGYGGYDVMSKTVPLSYKPAKDAPKPYLMLLPPKGGLGANNPYTSIKQRRSAAAVLSDQLASQNLQALANKIAQGRTGA